MNESQQVCPACGVDPIHRVGEEYDSETAAAVADVDSVANQLPLPGQSVEESLPVDLDVDYLPDPELDLMMAEGEAYLRALFKSSILVAGNQLIN